MVHVGDNRTPRTSPSKPSDCSSASPVVNRAEIVKQILEILRTKTTAPADSLIKYGKSLTVIGEALKQLPDGQQRDCLKAAALMVGCWVD